MKITVDKKLHGGTFTDSIEGRKIEIELSSGMTFTVFERTTGVLDISSNSSSIIIRPRATNVIQITDE